MFLKTKQWFQKSLSNARKWLKNNWNNILLSNAYVYGYPFIILGSISLITVNFFVILAWLFWAYSTIVYIRSHGL